MSENIHAAGPPSIAIRWLRPTTSTALLQLPTTPVTVNSIDSWVALTAEESLECETAWNALSEVEKAIALESSWNNTTDTDKAAHTEDSDSEDETIGVTIFDDRLFEVDVRTMEVGCPFAIRHLSDKGVAQTNILEIKWSKD